MSSTPGTKRVPTDPVERIVYDGLRLATQLMEESPVGLDFYLPEYDVHIEVCRFHTDRKIQQINRAPNVILIQGIEAAKTFVHLMRTR